MRYFVKRVQPTERHGLRMHIGNGREKPRWMAERYRGKERKRERERQGGSVLEAVRCAMDIHLLGTERSRSHSRTIIERRANGSKRARQAEGGGSEADRLLVNRITDQTQLVY